MAFPQNGGTVNQDLTGAYTPPAGNAVSLELTYTPARGDVVNLDFSGEYTPPAGNVIDLNFGDVISLTAEGIVTATLDDALAAIHGDQYHKGLISSATDDATSGFVGWTHANIGSIGVQTDSAAGSIDGQYVAFTNINASTDDATSSFIAKHDRRGTIDATTDDATGLNAEADLGIGSDVTSQADDATTTIDAVHGTVATISSTTDDAITNLDGLVVRYVLAGTVKDSDGFTPLEMTVRAHKLSDGTLVAETTSNAGTGAFSMVVGFAQDEYYVVSVDTNPSGTDFIPPIASHVLSVLESG